MLFCCVLFAIQYILFKDYCSCTYIHTYFCCYSSCCCTYEKYEKKMLVVFLGQIHSLVETLNWQELNFFVAKKEKRGVCWMRCYAYEKFIFYIHVCMYIWMYVFTRVCVWCVCVRVVCHLTVSVHVRVICSHDFFHAFLLLLLLLLFFCLSKCGWCWCLAMFHLKMLLMLLSLYFATCVVVVVMVYAWQFSYT